MVALIPATSISNRPINPVLSSNFLCSVLPKRTHSPGKFGWRKSRLVGVNLPPLCPKTLEPSPLVKSFNNPVSPYLGYTKTLGHKTSAPANPRAAGESRKLLGTNTISSPQNGHTTELSVKVSRLGGGQLRHNLLIYEGFW
jgi:hypothetical protein